MVKGTHVKAKSGQILILVLIIMAIGLIVISPLLSYQSSSYKVYTKKLQDAAAYIAIDAMMAKIFSDMYAGENIYFLNKSDSDRYNPEGEWLNGYTISTSVNNSIAAPPPPSGETGWVYRDPGCSFGLDTLAYGATYSFELPLTGGTTVTVNWYFKDSKASSSCNYYCNGSMWITYENLSTVQYVNGSYVDTGDTGNGVSTAFQQQLTWTVPDGGSGNYIINFKNLATRKTGGSCTGTAYRSMSDMLVKPTFSGIGDPLYTWVSLGKVEGEQTYQYEDYTIITTASLRNTKMARITACVRQSPGPFIWNEPQSLAVASWIVTYDPHD